ncbi:MAG: acylphosphatase [Aridibacter sp.]
MEKIARKYYISGLVQGVSFRFFTQRAAAKHQIRGYVKNLEDGRVEAYAEGDEKEIKAFHEEILTGPTHSRVEKIEEIVEEPQGLYSTFLIER